MTQKIHVVLDCVIQPKKHGFFFHFLLKSMHKCIVYILIEDRTVLTTLDLNFLSLRLYLVV